MAHRCVAQKRKTRERERYLALPASLGVAAMLFVMVPLSACQTRSFDRSQLKVSASSDVCTPGLQLNIRDYLEPLGAAEGRPEVFFPKLPRTEPGGELYVSAKGLYRSVPCNKVDLVSHAVSEEVSASGGLREEQPRFNSDVQMRWMLDFASRDTRGVSLENKLKVILMSPDANDTGLNAFTSNLDLEKKGQVAVEPPILQSPIHQAAVRLIQSAEQSVFVNFMLFGGYWGSEVVRQILLRMKEKPDLKVFFLADDVNRFDSADEVEPLWNALRELSKDQGAFRNMLVLPSLITQRPSALPCHLEKAKSLINTVKDELPGLNTDPLTIGKSDHSKVLIVDGFTSRAAALIGSKNIQDESSAHFDESVVVTGPAAVVAQMLFGPDVAAAATRTNDAAERAKLPNAHEALLVKEWLDAFRLWGGAEAGGSGGAGVWKVPAFNPAGQKGAEGKIVADSGPTKVTLFAASPSHSGLMTFDQLAGTSAVRLSENNTNDTVRNTENEILTQILGAKRSIRVYNFLAYNPALLEALAIKVVELGPENVRMIMDTTLGYALNASVELYLRTVAKSTQPEASAKINRFVESLRWRYVEPGGSAGASFPRQQHVKSIIIDEDRLVLGSANFDAATLFGSFREFNATVFDPPAAKQAAAKFDEAYGGSEAKSFAQIKKIEALRNKPLLAPVVEAAVLEMLKSEMLANGSLWPTDYFTHQTGLGAVVEAADADRLTEVVEKHARVLQQLDLERRSGGNVADSARQIAEKAQILVKSSQERLQRLGDRVKTLLPKRGGGPQCPSK